MNWKLKAAIQNAVSLLPSTVSYALYYWMQRHFGGLKHPNPLRHLTAGIKVWNLIKQSGRDPIGKVFLEIGTGREPIIPIAFWLSGAKKTITIDLNPYLKDELINESLRFISENMDKITKLFDASIYEDRLDRLMQFSRNASFSTAALLDLCCIDYMAPCDAGNTHLPTQSVDFLISFGVFQHIPSEVLEKIMVEGNRIVKDTGLFVHRIDYTDHFSHSDNTITALNFLQFSDNEWKKYAGNKYMYMNRLRHDDFINLFLSTGHRIMANYPEIDHDMYTLLTTGNVKLDERFKGKSIDDLSTLASWISSQKNCIHRLRRIGSVL
jgi:hypothetical protein